MSGDRHWFRLNSYESGWIPVTWQGWAVVAAFIAVELTYPVLAETGTIQFHPLQFLLVTALGIAALVTVCYLKSEKN